ncbi:MAG: TetR/AcrR family transcriptional regulator, partial [Thermoleophilia bacterium]
MESKKQKKSTRRQVRESGSARPSLTREGIVQAALKIMDRDGYTALSMRRLGTELKVDPMAVYYHFPNKSALLDGVVELVMSGIDLGRDDPSQTALERLCRAAHIYREALLAHPQAVQISAVRQLNTPASLRPVEFLLEILLGAGLSHTDSVTFVNIFGRFVRGVVLLEIREM